MKIDDLLPYMTARQAAGLLRLQLYTIRQWGREGRFDGALRGGMDGTAIMIPRETLLRMLDVGDEEEEL